MLQLNPGEKFLIARQLEDVNDLSVYYLKAVIKNSKNQILDEVILENVGNKLYIKEWTVPYNNTSNSYYITISIFVYEDENYTILSPNYGVRTDTYLVQERLTRTNIPTGADFSYRKIEEIVKKIVSDEVKKIKIEEKDYSDLLNKINKELVGLSNGLKKINNYTKETVDNYSKIITKYIENVYEFLKSKKEINYSDDLSEIKNNQLVLRKEIDDIYTILNSYSIKQEKELNDALEKVNSIIILLSKFSEESEKNKEFEKKLLDIKNILDKKFDTSKKVIDFKSILDENYE
ncbi:MAG: hypothetical protein N2Z85_00375 [Patescibacteria group bacterium]|nr:hypothetical protein [Patescibacteria group bacterium]